MRTMCTLYGLVLYGDKHRINLPRRIPFSAAKDMYQLSLKSKYN